MSFSKRLHSLAVAAVALIALAIPATASAGTASAGTARQPAGNSAPELWPKLAPFKTLVVSTLGAGATADQQLLVTSLEGAYNQLQRPNRLYVVWNPDDQTWLNASVLRGVHWSQLQGQGSGPGGQLDALLADYGHDIKGAIVTNPSDPDTVNLATTMAGIDDALVADPSQLPLLQRFGIPVLFSFAGRSFSSPTAAYQWGLTNLLPKTNTADLVMLNPGAVALRDYIIATRSFVFYLTSTNATEEPLMNQIISSRPANTPILGYVPDEGPDVADLSSLGHFLNASDFLENGSDFAAAPSARHLAQPRPEPVRAKPDTVYVSFVVSDGDNAQYVQHHMFDVWTGDAADMGTVPEGWTMAPGMADFAPGLIDWFYQNLPRDSELLAGPSGVGYATQMTGANLQRFGQLSGAFMRKTSMRTVDFWENATQIGAYAQSSGVPSISVDAPLAYMQQGKTAVAGQTSSYTDPPSALLTTIEQDALARPTSDPVFLEPLVDGWNFKPHDVLAVAQNLARWGETAGKNFVFITPSELALTEEAYHQGRSSSLPPLNSQAVSGAAELMLPSAGQLQGYTVPTVSGPNLIANPSGADGTAGWSDTQGTLSAGTYHGGPDLTWSVPANPGANPLDPGTSQQWVHVYPAVTDGDTYQFSVQVAGSGQVYMDTYNGVADSLSPATALKSSYQTLTWTVAVPSNAPTGQTGNAPQLQVREIGIGPVTVHIKNATVRLASPSSPSPTFSAPSSP
jgi:putative glycoside hydrolase with GxGYxYP motif/GxGYxY motif-containing protein